MNSSRSVRSMYAVLVLALSLLVLATGAWAQETESMETQGEGNMQLGTEIPRDSLLAAARDMMELTPYCALITLDASGHPRARTMDAYPVGEDMVIWMGTSTATRKVAEIRNDPRVTVYFAHPEHQGYVTVYGTAALIDSPEEKDKRWKKEFEQYFPEGKKSFILIAVTPQRIEVTDYSKGIMGDQKTWAPPAIEF
jgi:general stress protein 26